MIDSIHTYEHFLIIKQTIMNKKLFTLLLSSLFALHSNAQGWPSNYDGVMLQGFYWDSFGDTKWTKLESKADELSKYFDIVWVPNSGYCADYNNMGYLPLYYFNQNSTFGTEAELRSMIKTFKEKGLGTIADVVINHHNTNGWFGFPAETYKGQTYQLQSTDICRNDDGGAALTQANKDGVQLSANNDTGEGWDGCRDIDHKSANVNKVVKAYEDFLINDLGYAGFRYDMVKGYSASYTADYNTASKPQFSVGEYWDSSTNIRNWINGTKKDGTPTSAAFDFQFRYRVRDAINSHNWTCLKDNTSDAAARPLIYDPAYRQYAVTFVENHDTEKRVSANQDPIKSDTLAANAYLLAMPGTPCIFLKHWQDCKYDLKKMISIRKLVGINNQSTYVNMACSNEYYAVLTNGTRGKLLCVVGYAPEKYAANTSLYTLVTEGKGYRYYISNELVADWVTTLDGIDAEQKAEENERANFQPYSVNVYVKADFTPVYFYVWDSNNNTQLNGNWPGKLMTNSTVTINGETWYRQTFDIKSYGYYFNIIFNQGSGKPQTTDIENITSDRYFEASLNGTKITYTDVTSTVGIDDVEIEPTSTPSRIYNLMGQEVKTMKKGGIYIQTRRKLKIKN